jgi:hypothetical protein
LDGSINSTVNVDLLIEELMLNPVTDNFELSDTHNLYPS